MSNEDMKVRVEVWPVAADSVGMWLLSGDDAWRSPNVPTDDDPHTEVERLLGDTPASVIHSTSWRVDGPAVFLTYIAVVPVGDGLVLDRWAGARPISPRLAEHVGKPRPHAAADAPVPRYIDVLLHGLRHLAFLRDTDSPTRDALDMHWLRHLEPITPMLAGMYRVA